MAIDTAQKRASAFTFNSYWAMPSISPDGTLGQADRQQTLWNYSGILVGAAAPAPTVAPTVPIVVGGPYKPLPQILVVWVSFVLPTWALSVRAFQGHKLQRAASQVLLTPFRLRSAPNQGGSTAVSVGLPLLALLHPSATAKGRAQLYVRMSGMVVQTGDMVLWGEVHMRLMQEEVLLLLLLSGDSQQSLTTWENDVVGIR